MAGVLLWTQLCGVRVLYAQTEPGGAASQASAAPGASTSAAAGVYVRTVGGADVHLTDELCELLQARVSQSSWLVNGQKTVQSTRLWLQRVKQFPAARLAVVLLVSETDSWKLTVVDLQRSQAMTRELPGGEAKDAAALEAVVSIITSTIEALESGQDVGASPPEQALQSVLAKDAPSPEPVVTSPPTDKPRSTASTSNAGADGAARPAQPRVPTTPRVELAPPVSANELERIGAHWGLALGAELRSVTPTRWTAGPKLEGRVQSWLLGVPYWAALALSSHIPTGVSSDAGSFDLRRSFVALQAGPRWRVHSDVELSLGFGPVLALPRRENTVAGGALAASDDVVAQRAPTLSQPGLEAVLMSRFEVGSGFGVDVLVGAGAWLGPVRYVTSDGVPLLEPPFAHIQAALGLSWSR